MLKTEAYFNLITSIVGVTTSLAGSVGIFVSLTIQRRVERLQEILEEFLDLAYHSENNITGKMYKLIEKYQMQYLFPDTPVKAILQYINITIVSVVLSWAILMYKNTYWSFSFPYFIFFLPVLFGLILLIFYRHLLKSVMYPFGNNMMSPLIPQPFLLRSVSFLSKNVNVSIKTVLTQGRLRIIARQHEDVYKVLLKEELSLDDYIYYLVIMEEERTIFSCFGKLEIRFKNEPVTGKPVPAARNISIPLGDFKCDLSHIALLEAKLYIFPEGEKHPLQYDYHLKKQNYHITMCNEPEISVNYMITYQISPQGQLALLEGDAKPPFEEAFKNITFHGGKRFFRSGETKDFKPCGEDVFID